jgi:hypothetical protein
MPHYRGPMGGGQGAAGPPCTAPPCRLRVAADQWTALPAPVRDEIDVLLGQRELLRAIHVLKAQAPELGLQAVKDVVDYRNSGAIY